MNEMESEEIETEVKKNHTAQIKIAEMINRVQIISVTSHYKDDDYATK